MTPKELQKLRAPFRPDQIGKLPKPTKKENPKGRCKECGGWHGLPAIHLDFVGHAHVTDRLLSVDPNYEFGPVLDVNKRPVKEPDGSTLHYLTIGGSTKYEWGDGPNMKEISSDAIRRCAMRFGVGLDMWIEDAPGESPKTATPPLKTTKSQQQKIAIAASDAGLTADLRYRITYRLFGVTSSKDVYRRDVNRLLDAFEKFAAAPEASTEYLEQWEAEHRPTTAAQAIREGSPPVSQRDPGRAASPSDTSSPLVSDGEHILTREELEAAGQTKLDEQVVPD